MKSNYLFIPRLCALSYVGFEGSVCVCETYLEKAALYPIGHTVKALYDDTYMNAQVLGYTRTGYKIEFLTLRTIEYRVEEDEVVPCPHHFSHY